MHSGVVGGSLIIVKRCKKQIEGIVTYMIKGRVVYSQRSKSKIGTKEVQKGPKVGTKEVQRGLSVKSVGFRVKGKEPAVKPLALPPN